MEVLRYSCMREKLHHGGNLLKASTQFHHWFRLGSTNKGTSGILMSIRWDPRTRSQMLSVSEFPLVSLKEVIYYVHLCNTCLILFGSS